jgi:hypothetical protein
VDDWPRGSSMPKKNEQITPVGLLLSKKEFDLYNWQVLGKSQKMWRKSLVGITLLKILGEKVERYLPIDKSASVQSW